MARQQRLALHTPVRADQILRALSKWHTKDFFLTEVKSGPTWFADNLHRLDAVAIRKSWTQPCIRAYEVKVARTDFVRDDKWPAYLQYCHELYFACPKGLIEPGELPPEVGLIWYHPGSGALQTVKKAPYRSIDLPADFLLYVIMNRLDSDRHPFYSSQREYLEAWVRDKAERRRLGEVVKTRLAERLADAEERLENLRWKVDHLERENERLARVFRVLREYGFEPWGRDWEEALREFLSSRVPAEVVDGIDRIRRQAEELRRLLAPPQEEGEEP